MAWLARIALVGTAGCSHLFGLEDPQLAPTDAPSTQRDAAISPDEQARRAFLGLEASIARSIDLGFAGFNAAISAAIPPQTANANAAGTLTVTGTVDQGASDNKGMYLHVGAADYDDGAVPINASGDTVHIVYNTDTAAANQPYLELQLTNIPDGTLSGMLTAPTMTAVYRMTGDLEGELTLNLTIIGTLMQGPGNTTVVRVPDSTMVTGTATTKDGGTYGVSIKI